MRVKSATVYCKYCKTCIVVDKREDAFNFFTVINIKPDAKGYCKGFYQGICEDCMIERDETEAEKNSSYNSFKYGEEQEETIEGCATLVQ